MDVCAFRSWTSASKCLFCQGFEGQPSFWPGRSARMTPGRPRDIRPENFLSGPFISFLSIFLFTQSCLGYPSELGDDKWNRSGMRSPLLCCVWRCVAEALTAWGHRCAWHCQHLHVQLSSFLLLQALEWLLTTRCHADRIKQTRPFVAKHSQFSLPFAPPKQNETVRCAGHLLNPLNKYQGSPLPRKLPPPPDFHASLPPLSFSPMPIPFLSFQRTSRSLRHPASRIIKSFQREKDQTSKMLDQWRFLENPLIYPYPKTPQT